MANNPHVRAQRYTAGNGGGGGGISSKVCELSGDFNSSSNVDVTSRFDEADYIIDNVVDWCNGIKIPVLFIKWQLNSIFKFVMFAYSFNITNGEYIIKCGVGRFNDSANTNIMITVDPTNRKIYAKNTSN